MKILVTGSSGFLGSYLLENLDKSIQIEKFERKNIKKTDWNEIDGVIHCAGLAHNSHNKNLYNKYYSANFKLTKDIFLKFNNSNAKFFIFISTSTVYENCPTIACEKKIGKDLSIYAKTKLLAEKYILQKVSDKKVFVFRPSVIVGKNPKGNIELLSKIIKIKIPIPIPKKSAPNNLTDIRNLLYVIHFFIKNYFKIGSGVYNIRDNKRPDLKSLLIKIAKHEKQVLNFFKLPKIFFYVFVRIIQLFLPEIASKLKRLLFVNLQIDNNKLNSIIGKNLPFNSFE